MKLKSFTILLMILSLALLIVSGCDNRDFPTTTDNELVISRLTTSVDSIYADDNVTFAYIRAYVKDAQNFGVPETAVEFRTDRGNIAAIVYTDESGVAKTPFWDDGAEPGDANIEAFVKTYSEYDETQVVATKSMKTKVKIVEKPAVSQVNIEMASHDFLVNQSVLVRANVLDVLGQPVADSTLVRFDVTRGNFFTEEDEENIGRIAIVPTQNGNATIMLNVGQQAGMGSVRATIGDLISEDDFNVDHGNPYRLDINTYLAEDDFVNPEEADEASVDEPRNIYVEAVLMDAYNNPCKNKPVRFETDLGTFYNTSDVYSQNTDNTGICRAKFTPALSAGPANIKAYANADTLVTEALFTVKSDELNYIRFSTQEQVDLDVANTGGQDTRIMRVDLYDINDNLVDQATEMYFKIVNTVVPGTEEGYPATLSGQDDEGIVTVTSSGGSAFVSVVSGAGSGVLALRAANSREAITDLTVEDAIVATKSNIVIHSGNPAYVSVSIDGFDSAQQIGGGLWQILVAAEIKDTYNNPVDYGTAVFFSLPDEGDCIIQGSGYVGNGPEIGDAFGMDIDSTASIGIAYTLLSYPSFLTLQDINLEVSTIGGDGVEITNNFSITPPLNEAETDLGVTPAHINWYNDEPVPTYKNAIVTVRTRDGYGNNIEGAHWVFTSDRGEFVNYLTWSENPEFNECFTHADGFGKVKIEFWQGDCPPSLDGVNPGIQPVAIEGRILGTGISERGATTLLRYPFDNVK